MEEKGNEPESVPREREVFAGGGNVKVNVTDNLLVICYQTPRFGRDWDQYISRSLLNVLVQTS